MATLSLCMIVKNEEGFLEDCLNSIKEIADEIIIVDTGSKDNTKSIAEGFGAGVFDFRWQDDFSAARNFSLEKASSNWILVLDADEIIDDAGRKEILKLINKKEHCLKDVIGFKLDQRTYLPKKGILPVKTTSEKELADMYSISNSSKLVRLFKNNPKIRFRNKVHELVENSIKEISGEIVDTEIVIHHFSHLKKAMHDKAEKYKEMMWKQLEQDPKSPRYNRQVALAFLEQGKKELALKYITKALKANPNYPGLLADAGKIYVEMGQPEKAIKLFNMAIAKNKKDVSSLNNIAVLYMNLGKQETAKKLLEKALEAEPKNSFVLENYSKLKKMENKRSNKPEQMNKQSRNKTEK